MSWRVANTCAERKFGSATRKQIIMFLADKASDDGSGIWCSKGTIQRHTELGETTVIAQCVTLLVRSQAVSLKALRGLLNEEASYVTLDKQLSTSLSLAKDAEERLRQS